MLGFPAMCEAMQAYALANCWAASEAHCASVRQEEARQRKSDGMTRGRSAPVSNLCRARSKIFGLKR